LVYFFGSNISTTDRPISHTFCRSATKFGLVRGLANRNLFPEFREFWSGDPVIGLPCEDMHRSFTDTLLKWFLDNFPMFADSVSVLRPLNTAFAFYVSLLYCPRIRCKLSVQVPASRGGSLRQHGLLVTSPAGAFFAKYCDEYDVE